MGCALVTPADRAEALARLRPYIERSRTFSGWELGLQVTHLGPEPPWDYEAMARDAIGGAGFALDMGTGGGEVLSRIASGATARIVATEEWHVNAPAARDRLAPLGVPVVRARSRQLPFRHGVFDVVLNRHEELDPADVVRVLRAGGRIITQQVGCANDYELRAFFPEMQDFGDHYGEYQRGFALAGLDVQGREHHRRVAYATLGDLVFLLLVADWTIPGFDPERDVERLLAVERELGTRDGIVMTEHRVLITARDAQSESVPFAR